MSRSSVAHKLTPAADAARERRALTVVTHDGRAPQDLPERIAEINELTSAAALDALATEVCKVKQPHPARYIGAGALEALQNTAARCQARITVFGCDLSVTQTRNLEAALQTRVLDRTDLILDIFSRRAQSREGQLQVELAKCRRQLARLAGRWTHLERQRGGIGMRGGPGEKQMELDRRMLAARSRRLSQQIDKMAQRQAQARSRRRKNGALAAALVGYTNAGKSSLFNILARGSQVSDDRLFVTLDSATRRVFSDGGAYVLSDTVGFIRDLPHELVAGFQATLADTAQSDLLLIVVDAARPDWREQLRMVQSVLDDIGAARQNSILVLNKIDKADAAALPDYLPDCDTMRVVRVSCLSRYGVARLQRLIAHFVAAHAAASRSSDE